MIWVERYGLTASYSVTTFIRYPWAIWSRFRTCRLQGTCGARDGGHKRSAARGTLRDTRQRKTNGARSQSASIHGPRRPSATRNFLFLDIFGFIDITSSGRTHAHGRTIDHECVRGLGTAFPSAQDCMRASFMAVRIRHRTIVSRSSPPAVARAFYRRIDA
jgi:hypothetical protein